MNNNNTSKIECGVCLENKFFVSKTPCSHYLCIDCLFRLKQLLQSNLKINLFQNKKTTFMINFDLKVNKNMGSEKLDFNKNVNN